MNRPWRQLPWVLGLIVLLSASLPWPAQTATAATAAPKAFAASLALNGSSDYVEVPHNATLVPQSALTLEAWVWRSRTTPSGCEALVAKDYWLGLCFDHMRYLSGGGSFGQDGSTLIPAFVWTHLAVVWDSAGNTRRYYINGALDYTGSADSAPSGSARLRIGDDQVSEFFGGDVAEVRLWNVARSQDDIRRTMHTALDERLPGLVAVWHLSDDYQDNIGGFNGTPAGTASLSGLQAPPRPVSVPVDQNFNTLPAKRYAAAAAALRANQALLIGGIVNGAVSNQVDRVDTASGNVQSFATLPANRAWAAAAYAPTQNTVYIFGGSDNFSGSTFTNSIFAVDLGSTTTRLVAAPLPAPMDGLSAVYDARLDKIVLFGGYNGSVLSGVYVFDPVSETLSTPAVTLPAPRYAMGAAYAAATDEIYLFGGLTTGLAPTNTVYKVSLAAGGQTGAVTALGATLPLADFSLGAVEDATTRLIYVLGGNSGDHVLAFDPLTGELWQTLVQLPQARPYGAVLYSNLNRHALVMGGGYAQTLGEQYVWRVPLGDGPAVPLGRWDFPTPVGASVNAISGAGKRVFVATQGEGFWRYDETLSNGGEVRYQFPGQWLGSATGVVSDIYYAPYTHEAWIATRDVGGQVYDGSSIYTFCPNQLVTPTLAADYNFFGHLGGLAWNANNGCHNNFASNFIQAAAARPGAFFSNFQEWVIAGTGTPNLPNGIDPARTLKPSAPALASFDLRRLTYNILNGTSSESGPYTICGSGSGNDIAFDVNRDWWIPTNAGVCFIPAADTPGVSYLLQPQAPHGGIANQVAMDADGRVWIAFSSNNSLSGGLVAYQPVTTTNGTGLRTAEFNWSNAPLGGNIYYSGSWDSSLRAVGAADERVWTGKTNGQLATLAQRWQQLDQSDAVGSKVVEGVWLARGRAFLATSNSLHVLMPDGRTWDNRVGVHVRAVLGDSSGRSWVGTDSDVRRYTPAGWDLLAGTVGTPPAGPVSALAEDQAGRIWIGAANGLTLYDRNRFVFTLDSANSPLPGNSVQALLVDKDNRLWIGTSNGLAMLDGSVYTVFNASSGLPSLAIHALAQAGDGTIAASTASGVALYNGSSFGVESLPIPDSNLPLSVDDLGRLWAGSAVRTANGWQAYYLTNSGLRSSSVSGNAADRAERVWFSHAPDTGVSVRGTFLPPLADTVPLITSISPDHGSAGDLITVSGSGFGADSSVVRLLIGGYEAEIAALNDTSLLVRLTENNLSGDVSVSVNGRRTTFVGSGRPAFCAVPRISSVSPSGGNVGVRVDVKGSNFDPDATLTVGGGPAHPNAWRTPTLFKFTVLSTDATGDLTVSNVCAGPTYQTSFTFRVFTLNIDRVLLNQGYNAYQLLAGRPTLFQYYLTRSLPLYANDDARLEIDAVQLTFTNPGTNHSHGVTIPISGTLPTTLGPPGPALLKDIVNSLNVKNVEPNPNDPLDQNMTLQIHSVLMNHGLIVAQATTTQFFQANETLGVLLIPVMPKGFSQAQLQQMQLNVDSGLDDARRRLLPPGSINFMWADEAVLKDGPVDVGSAIDLYDTGHSFDQIRKRWNKGVADEFKASIAFGVVFTSTTGGIAGGTDTGKGLWPNLSKELNVALGPLDTLCDVGGGLLSFFTFGAAGGDCHLEVPLYVGWAIGGDRGSNMLKSDASALYAHEIGHIFSLVTADAQNGDLFNNFSHSVNDELDNGECNSKFASFNWARTLYAQPGVSEPIVNPIQGIQLRPQNDGDPSTGRAKAIMAYACGKNNLDTFFEPPDITNMNGNYGLYDFANHTQADASAQSVSTPRMTPRVVPGPRVHVSGVITPGNNTGQIRFVESLDDAALLSVPYVTGYWLVQLDAQGNELARVGVLPSLGSESTADAQQFFSGTMVGQPNTRHIELRHDKAVLDQFSAGSATPSITLSSPAGGTFNAGNIPVTWAASDADGDPLSIAVEYTSDGAHWTPVGSGSGTSGTLNVPVYLLGGSNSARVRAFASDGLHSGVFTSTVFSVANQPPQAYISGPAPNASVLEGQALFLTGGAYDNQDGTVAGANLRWRSDRDGELGTGSELGVMLSVGTHTLTLLAQNSKGLTATASVSLTVVGDYLGDGIADGDKLASGLNPLDRQAVYSDADGDGLPYIMERLRGTNPNLADSDVDGYSDAAEIAAGTDPLDSHSNPGTLPADTLVVAPRALTFTVNMGDDVPLPQAAIYVGSRNAVSWTLTSNVPWLAASANGGQTPGGTVVHAQTFMLGDGTFRGALTFTSVALNSVVTVPVTLAIQNSVAYCDVNRDGRTNSADVQLVTAAVGSHNTQPGFNYRYDLNRDGVVDAADVALVTTCVPGGKLYLPLIGR